MKIIKAGDFKLKIFNNNAYYMLRGTYGDKTFIYRINWEYYYGSNRRRFILCSVKDFNKIQHKGFGIKDLIRNMYYNHTCRYGRKIYFRPNTYPVENFEIYEFNSKEEFNDYIDRLNMLNQLVK